MSETKIEVGQIWEVLTDTFISSGHKQPHKRGIKLNKGERIEIRYAYEWHFRTVDKLYMHADPETIQANCKLFGMVWGKVSYNNKASLEEILRLKLYDAV